MERLVGAREELRDAQARLRAKKIEPEALREAERAHRARRGRGGHRRRARVARGAGTGRRRRASPCAHAELKKGARVWVPRLRAEAEVVEVCGEQVRVAAGPLKLSVAASELRATAPPEAPRVRPARACDGGATSDAPRRGAACRRATTPAICAGCAWRTRWPMAMSFLDRASASDMGWSSFCTVTARGRCGRPSARSCGSSAHVAKFRAGDTDQGGDGVTVVWLA